MITITFEIDPTDPNQIHQVYQEMARIAQARSQPKSTVLRETTSEPPTNSGSGYVSVIDPEEASVSEIQDAVGNLIYDQLVQLLEAEQAGKNRKTALKAINDAIDALESDEDENPEPEEDEGVTESDIRKKMAPIVKEHRDELKAKLTELGASKLPELDEEHYDEFYAYLEELTQ